jgi:hypothetical protein
MEFKENGKKSAPAELVKTKYATELQIELLERCNFILWGQHDSNISYYTRDLAKLALRVLLELKVASNGGNNYVK